MSAEHSQPRSELVGRGKAAATLELEQAARDVLVERHPLTLRQLYYGLVSRGALPKTEGAYAKLKRVMRDVRESGACPWDWVVDHVRSVFEVDSWDSVEGLLNDTSKLYRRDLMRQQDVSIQLWAESDSIGSVIAPVADRYTIPTYIGRGYASRGYLWSAARDAVAAHKAGKEVVILHVGDFDPSGEDIFRDVEETLRLYATAIESGRTVAQTREFASASRDLFGIFGMAELADIATGETDWFDFERLALTQQQVDRYHLPSRPPKASDVRTAKFTGSGAVEVEALPVDVLLTIVEQAIVGNIDERQLQVVKAAEESEREQIRRIAATPVGKLLEVAS
jgi:hypothetical protein